MFCKVCFLHKYCNTFRVGMLPYNDIISSAHWKGDSLSEEILHFNIRGRYIINIKKKLTRMNKVAPFQKQLMADTFMKKTEMYICFKVNEMKTIWHNLICNHMGIFSKRLNVHTKSTLLNLALKCVFCSWTTIG